MQDRKTYSFTRIGPTPEGHLTSRAPSYKVVRWSLDFRPEGNEKALKGLMPGNFLPALFLPLLSLSPLAPLSVPAPRVSGVHGLNFLIPPAPHPGSLSSMYRPLAAPTSTPSRSLSSNLLPFVFLEVPFYLGFSISPSLFHYFTLSFSLLLSLSVFLILSLGLCSIPCPVHSQVWKREKDVPCPRSAFSSGASGM